MASFVLIVGLDLDAIATVGTFLSNIGTIIVVITLVRMPKVVPEAWKKSMFHIPDGLYYLACVLAFIVCVVFEYFLFDILSPFQKVCIVVYGVLSIVYSLVVTRMKGGKQVEIQTDYEDS